MSQIDPLCLHKLYKILKDYERISLKKNGRTRKGFQRVDWILEYVEREILKI